MALKVERVMDGGVHIEKALGRASRLEPLHFTLSSSHDLVGCSAAIWMGRRPLTLIAARQWEFSALFARSPCS